MPNSSAIIWLNLQWGLGNTLDVSWNYIIALVASIDGVHGFLVAETLLIGRPVVVFDDSDLSTTTILYGLVGRLVEVDSCSMVRISQRESRRRSLGRPGEWAGG